MADMEDLDDSVAGLLGALLVRRLRLRHGEGNLERVAELVGLSARTLQRIEKGQSTPPPKTLALLAQTAGISRPLLERLQSALEAHRLAEAPGLAGEQGSPQRPFPAEVIAAA